MSVSGMPTRRTLSVSSACSGLILVLLFTGCGETSQSGSSVPEPEAAIPTAEIRLLTGTLTRVDQGWTMTSCDESTTWTLLDPVRNLDSPMGFGSVYAKGPTDGGWSVEHVNYLPFEGFDCGFDWDGVLWRAAGNEPFWMAQVAEDGLSIILGNADMIVVPVEAVEGPAFMGPGVMLRFAEETCADTMVDSLFGWTAELILGDETYLGCGFEGMAAQVARP